VLSISLNGKLLSGQTTSSLICWSEGKIFESNSHFTLQGLPIGEILQEQREFQLSSLKWPNCMIGIETNDNAEIKSLVLADPDKSKIQTVIFGVRKLGSLQFQTNGESGHRITLQRAISFPEDWTLSTDGERGCQIIEVSSSSPLYKNLSQDFFNTGMKTIGNSDKLIIENIYRIENAMLWEDFQVLKKRMATKILVRLGNSTNKELSKTELSKIANEQILYHGTKSDMVNSIAREGFDWRLAGSSTGTLYGRGSYFAKFSKYAHDYAKPDSKGIRCMFVAKVLVGTSRLGTLTMKKPDPQESSVDNVDNPQIFVVYHLSQAYPAYLIKYRI